MKNGSPRVKIVRNELYLTGQADIAWRATTLFDQHGLADVPILFAGRVHADLRNGRV